MTIGENTKSRSPAAYCSPKIVIATGANRDQTMPLRVQLLAVERIFDRRIDRASVRTALRVRWRRLSRCQAINRS